MRNVDISDAMFRIVTILGNLKPGENVNIQADIQGRADIFMVTQHSKRILFNNKEVWQESKEIK